MNYILKTGIVLSVLVAVGACSESPGDSDRAEDARYQSQAEVTLEQAKQTAEAAQNGIAIGIELDEENGSLVYEVEFVDADVLVDAVNGEVLSTEPENDASDREQDTQYQSLATVTLEQAMQTAEDAHSGTPVAINLDEEDGSLVYEVEFPDADVFVDAGNGEVLQVEPENSARETPIQGSIQVPSN